MFPMLFVIFTFRAYKLSENQTYLAKNLKYFGFAEPVEPTFSNSGQGCFTNTVVINFSFTKKG